jgi:ribosome recycling factor
MLDEVLDEVQQMMDKALDALGKGLASIRTGRANISLLDNIRVSYYGNSTPLSQVATVSVPEPRLIVIKPWEQNILGDIERAILADTSLGLNPSNDGSIIRLPIPELTGERRQELTKVARNRGEEGRVAVRHARREGLDMVDAMQKDGEISEDESRQAHEKVQKMTDEFVKRVDRVTEAKESEILEI